MIYPLKNILEVPLDELSLVVDNPRSHADAISTRKHARTQEAADRSASLNVASSSRWTATISQPTMMRRPQAHTNTRRRCSLASRRSRARHSSFAAAPIPIEIRIPDDRNHQRRSTTGMRIPVRQSSPPSSPAAKKNTSSRKTSSSSSSAATAATASVTHQEPSLHQELDKMNLNGEKAFTSPKKRMVSGPLRIPTRKKSPTKDPLVEILSLRHQLADGSSSSSSSSSTVDILQEALKEVGVADGCFLGRR